MSDFSSFMSGIANGKGLGAFGKAFGANGSASSFSDALNAAGQLVGNAASGVIGGGLQSGAGNVIGGLSTVASAIPGPWGAVSSAGLGIIGGLTNRAFGSKLNQENINTVNDNINRLSNFNSNAGSFDDLTSTMESMPASLGFGNSYIGKDGWFSHKARKRANQLRQQQEQAQLWADDSITNNLQNLQDEQYDNMLANFSAMGGPLSSYGADWTNGLKIIDAGGTHEQNPYGGVPMGIAPDGQPNLVEEGEVIFNDYVFSNRLRVPKAVREKYKLRGQKEMTFADAAKKAQKESEERPNDPISQRGLEDIMYRLMTEQEAVRESRQQRKYSEGGKIHIAPSKKGTFTAAASKHGMGVQEFASKVLANPEDYSPAMRKKANFARNASKWKHAYGGIIGHYFDGTNPEGQFLQFYTPEEKMVRNWQNRGLLPTPTLPKPTQLPYSLQTPQQRQAALDYKLEVPSLIDTRTPTERWIEDNIKPVSFSTRAANTTTKPVTTTKPKTSPISYLRFAPALGAGIGVFSDLMGITNKPDYSNADMVLNASNGLRDVRFTPIGDYEKYSPFDRMYYINQLNANAGATRRTLLDTTGGNRGAAMAGLLAADYNAQNQLGALARQAEEYNLAQRNQVSAFNRQTNEYNSEGDLKAQIANNSNREVQMRAAAQAAALRDAVDARVGAARSANLTNFFNSLGDIGRERYVMDMIMNNPSLLYDWMGRYKGKLLDDATGESTSNAKGGYLTIKRRR